MKKIAVIIPCHNEEKGIGKVLASFPHDQLKTRGYTTEIIVVDNASTDATAAVAKSFGVTVCTELRLGKGYAMQNGFSQVPNDVSYVVMLDGDNTYKPSEIFRMIEPLESKFCQVVVGSRLSGKMNKTSLNWAHRIANWTFTFLVRHLYLANVTDVLSGYFAFKREVLEVLLPHLTANGFAIEMEMITKCHKLGFDVYSVPITYDLREGRSKLHSFRDGFKIFSMLFRTLSWKPVHSNI